MILNNKINNDRYKKFFNIYKNNPITKYFFNIRKSDFYKDLDIEYFKNINPLSIIKSDIDLTLISNILNFENYNLTSKTPIKKYILFNNNIINWTEYIYSGISSLNYKEIKNPFDDLFQKYQINKSNYKFNQPNRIPSWITNDPNIRNIITKN